MLRPRIIPCLLVHNGGLVKTVKFADPKYVGDPINAVRIFNEKEVDELMVLDIDATVKERKPDYGMIRNLAAECRMPLCYGGGVKTVEQFDRIVSLGVEKVSVSSAVVDDPELVGKAAELVGNQSVVVVMDVRRNGNGGYKVWTHNAGWKSERSATELSKEMEALGAGEVVINSIDNEGTMKGYDLEAVRQVREAVSVPMTVLGGAGSLEDMGRLIREFGIIGAAAGSLFVFKGKYRAVLISYPGREEKEKLYPQITPVPSPGATPEQ